MNSLLVAKLKKFTSHYQKVLASSLLLVSLELLVDSLEKMIFSKRNDALFVNNSHD